MRKGLSKMERIKKMSNSKAARVVFVIMLCAVSNIFRYFYLIYLKINDNILLVRNESYFLPQMLIQNVIEGLPVIIMLTLTLVFAKKDFYKEKLYFFVSTKTQKIIVFVLLAILAIRFLSTLAKNQDSLMISYQLFYSIIFFSFFQEFEFRGLYPALLKKIVPEVWVWIIPTVLYSFVFLFTVYGFCEMDVYIFGAVCGYAACGITFEFFKRISGSIWIAILIHASIFFNVLTA